MTSLLYCALRWLYIVFLAREAWVQMARAREYLKKRKTTKINMAARLLPRVAFHLPLSFLSRTSVHQKMPKNVLKNTLLSTSPDVVKRRTQFAVLTHAHNLRNSEDLNLPKYRTVAAQRGFFYRAVKAWNGLNNNTRSAQSLRSFKKYAKAELMKK